ncbi:manganese catalase family protein [Pontibacter akesuensis]|uniref:Mn-containing catalase n=1 Tax=Pontibacter akesuensis TaxID=388950 RepID=A0A1I7FLE1_9BACT|nr:manganese catalase family protein [Pontibacter akesuensis]GHA61620.1 catalase [Pontibacter akesuensis]SFU36958.1 Mn-containing catalase [Pontibacter akesuensis]
MFYHDNKLQYKVRVDKPNPAFANMLQQAIGGIEGEIRVCLQYLFQAWGSRGPQKYRDMLMETGTEEIAHIEMLATAVALNLEGAPMSMKDEMAKDQVIGAVMGGMNPRHVLSSGLAAMAVDSNGVPFNGSWVVGSGNLAADMYANVMAESTGRLLATRLWEATDDTGMKDMLAFLIARDTMHQNQWLAVLEELGGLNGVHPIPNSFPQTEENQENNYNFVSTRVNDMDGTAERMRNARWGNGTSMDGKGTFTVTPAMPKGDVPQLAPPDPRGHAQVEQMTGSDGSLLDKAKNIL